ncbi:GAF domain-containing protein [Arthrobacter sp. KK5.5]|uniref:GAF domain-containing protein n=1 Tax=Arthrobacter sp. KK5.5 TaxID=3373084 RepID=UPI003EE7022D
MGSTTPASRTLQRHARAAHAVLGHGRPDTTAEGSPLSSLRPVVHDSWLRSLDFLPDPDRVQPGPGLAGTELEAYRRAHPLAVVMPVIDRLLVQPARDTGLLVAVGDEFGRLLWVEGDSSARRRAEGMAFVPGADWSERSVGTSAPGTALATGRGVQVSGAEHYSRQAHRWSCTAVPVHDPVTGRLIGVVDLTGNADAVAAHSLSLLHAAVAAAEADLRFGAARGRAPRRSTPRVAARAAVRPAGAGLAVLGHDAGVLTSGGTPLALGGRHAEILTLLAWHRSGLDADALTDAVLGDSGQRSTLRAEMVRLRRALAGHDSSPSLVSRPYRLEPRPALDARDVLDLVARGQHRRALAAYRGPVLPRSSAPGIEAIRAEVSGGLRQGMLQDAGADVLMDYLELPEAARDAEALHTALQVLPPRSPRRAVVVDRLERLETELA